MVVCGLGLLGLAAEDAWLRSCSGDRGDVESFQVTEKPKKTSCTCIIVIATVILIHITILITVAITQCHCISCDEFFGSPLSPPSSPVQHNPPPCA